MMESTGRWRKYGILLFNLLVSGPVSSDVAAMRLVFQLVLKCGCRTVKTII